jgi:RNA polymerase sigma factor (sigma-70 family)
MATVSRLQGSRGHARGAPAQGSRIARLVGAAAEGDQYAWEGLVAEFNATVTGVARAHGMSDVDVADVAQTTWLRLVEHLPRIHEPDRIGAWLATTAARESLRLRRRASRQLATDRLPEPIADDDIAQRVLRQESYAAVRQAFAQLRSRDQALLGLLVADPPPSYAQIGRILEMPVGSIGPTRERSLTRLRHEAALVGLTSDPIGAAA